MAELVLKQVLKDLAIPQKAFAANVGLGGSAFNLLVNHNQWPKSVDSDVLKRRIIAQLRDNYAIEKKIELTIFDLAGGVTDPASRPIPNPFIDEYDAMLPGKQTLLPVTKKHFQLFRDPFGVCDVTTQEDVFMTPSIRYVREALYQTARLGGFIAVVGESGSGKSILRKDMITRLMNENQSVTIVEPFVLGMEDNDKLGKRLSSGHIAEAVIQAIDPLAKAKSSAEARFRQMHQLLLDSFKAGNKHCLIIEEAHGLSIPTLKHLKRFYEIEHGFAKLLSIILIGQPELHAKLSVRNLAVREVVQRCEVVTLEPLDQYVRDYLSFKFTRAGADVSAVFDDSAFDAIKAQLTIVGNKLERHSLLYPLAVNNLALAAMNLAAELLEPKVGGDVVAQVG